MISIMDIAAFHCLLFTSFVVPTIIFRQGQSIYTNFNVIERVWDGEHLTCAEPYQLRKELTQWKKFISQSH